MTLVYARFHQPQILINVDHERGIKTKMIPEPPQSTFHPTYCLIKKYTSVVGERDVCLQPVVLPAKKQSQLMRKRRSHPKFEKNILKYECWYVLIQCKNHKYCPSLTVFEVQNANIRE